VRCSATISTCWTPCALCVTIPRWVPPGLCGRTWFADSSPVRVALHPALCAACVPSRLLACAALNRPSMCTPFSGKLKHLPTLTGTTRTQTELERRPASSEVKMWLRSKAEAEETAAAEAKANQRLTELQTKLDNLPKSLREESKASELALEHRLTAAAATSVDAKLSAMHRALADDVQVRWDVDGQHTQFDCHLCWVGD
jgi:hypothetical protein